MGFLHRRAEMGTGDVAIVDCAKKCRVMLMNDANFSRFRDGKKFFYYGGFYQYLPASIAAPASGYWNVVLDLIEGATSPRHSIQVIRNS